jgi:hypothetical protein
MFDVEPLILGELQRLSPLDKREPGDWEAILTRVTPERRARKAAIQTALAFAVIAAVVIPALAFSATVRSLVGLGQPAPKYDQARLRLEVALPQGYVARLWTAPSTQGGACMFTTYDASDAPSRPKKITGGGGFCSRAGALAIPRRRFYWSVGTALGGSYVLSGVASPALHVSQMTLRWHGGAQAIATRDTYFLAAVPVVASPPFRLLPFDLVATNDTGRTVYRHRIPTSFLYFARKHVEPKLRAYRKAHGCSKRPPIWHCRSR